MSRRVLRVRPALLAFAAAAVAVAVVVWAAARGTGDAQAHGAMISDFDRLARIETSFDSDLLRMVAGLLPHYDSMVSLSHQWDEAVEAILGAGTDDPEVHAALAQYRDRAEAKRLVAEQIQGVSAFIRREISYLPFAVAQFAATADPALAAQVQATLIALEAASLSDDNSLADMDKAIAAFAAHADPALAGIGLHMATLTQQLSQRRQAMAAYRAADSMPALETARSAYMATFGRRQMHRQILTGALQATALLLFLALGWAIRREGRAHDQAQLARARLADAVASLSEGFALFDQHRQLVQSNPVYDRMLGTAGPVADFDRLMGLLGSHMEAIDRPVAAPATDHPQELLLRRRDSSQWFLFRSHVTATGGLVCLFTDLTTDKRNEVQLRKLTAAVEQSPLAVVITDAEGHIEYVNPAFLSLTGYSRAEVVGATPRLLKSGAVAGATYAELWRTLKAGLTWHGELVNRKKSGELFCDDTVISPVRDPVGHITHFIAVKEDVTRQKRNADLLTELNADLERMLFATSHDLQEPVRAIQIYCQKLERQLPADSGAEAQESMGFIAAGARQISLLVAGLSAYSRSGRPMGGFVPTDCHTAAEAAIAECRDQIRATGAQIQIGSLPVVGADPVLLVMALRNLLANALKFRRADTPPRIRVEAVRDASGWRIDIADNGIGIEAQYLDAVLRPFSRLHPSADYPGAGMGLASCVKIARLHGGRLWLDSTPGSGTTAHLWLPDHPGAA